MTRSKTAVFVAIDTPDLERAGTLAAQLAGLVGGVKLGLEFFSTHGPQGIEAIARHGHPLFLDLKFHDIPNTVAGAVRAVLRLRPSILTVHASGGEAMLSAAAEAAAEADTERPRVVGVTVLTSLDGGDLAAVGQEADPAAQAGRLALLAAKSGLDGVVCSPHEAAALRAHLGETALLVVPGVRPDWATAQDQKRIMTPRQAADAGADVLVIGRPITGADDPAEAARRIGDELAG